MKITCDIEMSIASGFANFVGDDTLVDATVGMAHRAEDQAVDITNCRMKQRSVSMFVQIKRNVQIHQIN